jgi:hypothetical protein
MQYLILRKADQDTESSAMPGQALIDAMGSYNQQLVDAGVMRSGEGLKPTKEAVRLSLAPGKMTIVDGPFTETKEIVAGISVFECASKQEAIDWVLRWPVEDGDGNVDIEIRESGCPGGCAEIHPNAAANQNGERFVVLLRSSADLEAEVPVAQEKLDRLDAFNAVEAEAGVLLAADGLRSSARGARVNFTNGKASVVDGPFTEIKEMIAGYWMIRAASMQDAIEWARRIPYPTGPEVELEVRKVYEMDDLGIEFTAELRDAEAKMRAQQLEAGMRAQLAARG